MSEAKGYPHKQTFNIKSIRPNAKSNAWYKKSNRNHVQQPKAKD